MEIRRDQAAEFQRQVDRKAYARNATELQTGHDRRQAVEEPQWVANSDIGGHDQPENSDYTEERELPE